MDTKQQPEALRAEFFPMLNAFGEAQWQSGRGVPHHDIQDLGEAVFAMVERQHARITELESQLAQRFDAADLPEALRRSTAADGKTELFNLPGYPLMVRAVDFNRIHAESEMRRAALLDEMQNAALAAGQATAAQAGAPANMQVTERMRAAGDCAWMTADRVDSARVFRAMLAAAPAQPAAQQPHRSGCTAGTDEACVQRGCGTNCPAVSPRQGVAYAALPEPLEIDWPELHSQALGCGVEDRGLHNRYECAEYGWQDGVDKCAERVPEQIFDADQMRAFADATHTLRASHGQAPAGATPECLTCSDHGAVGNILTAEPCPDCTRLNAQPAPATQQAAEREQERIAFKDAHRHLDLDEVPDAWGRPMFKHSHVEASWLGWIARASRGKAPAGEAILFEHEDGRYAINPDTTGDPAWHRLGHVELSVIAAPAQSGLMDAYVGAREDLSIWKRRALEAEATVRNFVREANSPTFMGDPASDECQHGDAFQGATQMTNTTTTSGAADLRTAAQAVVDRWDTPLWKDVPATAEYIGRLRAALAAGQATAAQQGVAYAELPDERAAFEAWYIAQVRSKTSTTNDWSDDEIRGAWLSRPSEEYRSSFAGQSWEAWQARASHEQAPAAPKGDIDE